jgi:hypothetical protein
VFGIGPATRIYLAVGATDTRKGFNGLYGLVLYSLLIVAIDVKKSRLFEQKWLFLR